ncbi:hypothetical protein XAUB_35450 [Xanthomonas citri pv. aurantifolii str. ICPB 11122]|nr:hypothetical protein XAUB_35450 [Xanthomonas citri pv. aurantifolii str. ICPB 11122]
MITGTETDQAGHADIERVVPLHVFLAAQRMHHRCTQSVGQRHHCVMRPGAATAAQHRHRLALLQELGQLLHILGGRQHPWLTQRRPRTGDMLVDLQQRDIAGNHHHRHTLLQDGRAHRPMQHFRQLRRVGHQLHEVTALAKQLLRMGFLKIAQPDLGRRNMRGDRQHRLTAAMAIEQPVDQMQIARPATAGTHLQLASHRRFGTRRERGHFLMAHMHPLDGLHLAQGIGQAIEAVTGHPPDPLNPRAL